MFKCYDIPCLSAILTFNSSWFLTGIVYSIKNIYVHNNIIEDFYNRAFMHPRKSLDEDLLEDFDKLVAELYANSKPTRISDSLDYESLYELE